MKFIDSLRSLFGGGERTPSTARDDENTPRKTVDSHQSKPSQSPVEEKPGTAPTPRVTVARDDEKERSMAASATVFGSDSAVSSETGMQKATQSTAPTIPTITIDRYRFPLVTASDALGSVIAKENRAAIRFPTLAYKDVSSQLWDAIEQRFGKTSPQCKELAATVLMCAGCLWEYPHSYRMGLVLGGDAPILFAAPGFEEFSANGICPQCRTNESLLVYEYFPADEITPSDVLSIEQYWKHEAIRWWSVNQHTQLAECERYQCRAPLKWGEGFFHHRMVCEVCAKELLKDALQELRDNPSTFGIAVLRKARALGGLAARSYDNYKGYFDYPAGWKVVPESRRVLVYPRNGFSVTDPGTGKSGLNVWIQFTHITAGANAAPFGEYLRAYRENAKNVFSNFSNLCEQKITLSDGAEALQRSYAFTVAGHPYRFLGVVADRMPEIFHLDIVGLEFVVTAMESDCSRIMHSLRPRAPLLQRR